MSEPIILGTAGDSPLELDLERLVGSHACIIANSGGGKSGLLRKMLEQTHGRVQHIVLDVEDEFYSLRERFEYVIAGGEDGDVPISLDSASSLATNALEHGFSLIVQLNDLGADAPEFVSRFLAGLMGAPKDLWHPVLVTIDELQRFASKDSGEATPAIKDLMFRGRKRGFTGLFASLRMAEIDPGIRGMVNNWMLGRVGQALDRKTMAEQLGFSASEARGKLAHMVERHFWAMGPALTVEPTLFKVAQVETTPVHAGQAKVPTPPAPEALREILAGLAAVQQPTDEVKGQGASPPRHVSDEKLMRRIAELEAERDGLVAEHGFGQQQLDALVAENRKLRDIIEAAWTHAKLVKPTLDGEPFAQTNGQIAIALAKLEVPPAGEPANTGGGHEVAQQRESNPEGRAGGTSRPSTADGITKGEQEILDALLWCDALYRTSRHDRHIVAALVGNHVRTKGFLNRLGSLRSAGLIDYGSGDLFLTEAGYQAANTPDVQPTVAGARAAVKRILTLRQSQILDMTYHDPVTRLDIAGRLGLHERSKGFLNDLGRLRGLKLIDYHGGSTVWAEAFLRDTR